MFKIPTCFVLVAVLIGCSQSGSEQTAPGSDQPLTSAPTDAPAQPGSQANAQPGGQQPLAAPPATRSVGSSPANTGAAPSAAVPPVPPQPQFRELTIPAGTRLSLTLSTSVASDTSKVEDAVRARLAKPVMIDGVEAMPQGAELVGSVTEAERSGRVKGLASVAFRFQRLTAWDETHDIQTARIARQAESTKKEDATKVGIGAGAGALIGAIAGGGKGAAIGGAVGAGAGTGAVMATRGDEVSLPAGTTVTTTLQEPLTVRVPLN
ncbi:MAG: hypothetical protein EHM89_06260 [Acidobacteria bacterium]|nr:MAG: hypothetical protein EHM89_06260 [Acidobacteriota bacterium]